MGNQQDPPRIDCFCRVILMVVIVQRTAISRVAFWCTGSMPFAHSNGQARLPLGSGLRDGVPQSKRCAEGDKV
jgi:acid phosphatase family membrane protein YuiD